MTWWGMREERECNIKRRCPDCGGKMKCFIEESYSSSPELVCQCKCGVVTAEPYKKTSRKRRK